MGVADKHMRHLRAGTVGVVHTTPPECIAVHDWLCASLERTRIAEEARFARFTLAEKRRLAQARNAA